MIRNICILTGNVGKDPELKYTSRGTAMFKFSLAVDEPTPPKTEGGEWQSNTTWINCVAWDKLAERMAARIQTGTQVQVVSKYRKRSYEDNEGQTKYAHDFKVENYEVFARGVKAGETSTEQSNQTIDVNDEEFPF